MCACVVVCCCGCGGIGLVCVLCSSIDVAIRGCVCACVLICSTSEAVEVVVCDVVLAVVAVHRISGGNSVRSRVISRVCCCGFNSADAERRRRKLGGNWIVTAGDCVLVVISCCVSCWSDVLIF